MRERFRPRNSPSVSTRKPGVWRTAKTRLVLWGTSEGAGSFSGAVSFARGLAILYAVLAVMGLIPGLNTMFGLAPLHGNDIWLHAGTALIAAYFGWGAAARDRDSATLSR